MHFKQPQSMLPKNEKEVDQGQIQPQKGTDLSTVKCMFLSNVLLANTLVSLKGQNPVAA